MKSTHRAVSTKARARLETMAAWDAYVHQVSAVGGRPSTVLFLQRLNAGDIQNTATARSEFQPLQLSTFNRWLHLREKGGDERLHGNYGQRLGCGTIQADARIQQIILEQLRKSPRPSWVQIQDHIKEGLGLRHAPPSIRTIQRFVAGHKATSPI